MSKSGITILAVVILVFVGLIALGIVNTLERNAAKKAEQEAREQEQARIQWEMDAPIRAAQEAEQKRQEQEAARRAELDRRDAARRQSRSEVIALHNRGISYFDKSDYREAIKWFHRATEQGAVPSYVYVGLCISGMNGNVQESMQWYRKGAELGDDMAQLALAMGLRGLWNGTGFERHRIEAREWIQKSAAQGNQDAINTLREWNRQDR